MKNSGSPRTSRKALSILVGFFVFVAGIGLSLSTVEAASSVVPQSGPKGEAVHGSYKGQDIKVQTMLFRVDLNGTPSFMFCIDIGTAIEFGVSYTETDWDVSHVPNLNKVARILAQTNAATSHDPIEIAAAQAAIWHFSDGFELNRTSGHNNPYVVARYNALVEDANANPVADEPDATLTVEPSNATTSYGQPVFYEVASTTDGPIAIELSDSLVSAHPASGDVCDVATRITTTIAGARICLTSASPRSDVKATLRTQSAPLSAGRVFVRPGRQKLIITKGGVAQSHETVSASWSENGRPSVTVVCPPGGVTVGVPTTYTAQASDPDGDVLRYSWTVNGTVVDGADQPTFTHTPKPGDQIRVSVTDAVGQSAAADVTCTASTAPVVEMFCPSSVTIGAENTFTASATDPESDVVRYEWTLNGNVIPGVDGPSFTAVINPGDDLRVRAIDAAGNASDASVASCIPTEVNVAPEVSLQCPDNVPAGGGKVTFIATATDRNGDEITFRWFINGTQVEGETSDMLTADLLPGDVVAVEASDGTAASERVEVDCVVPGTNQPPVVALVCPSAILYGEASVFTATGSDPDGDLLTYRWKHNGVVDERQTGPQATFVIEPGDTVSVVAIDEVGGGESTEIVLTCEGSTRPTVTISCPLHLTYGEPVTFIANGVDPNSPAALTYRWELNGVPIDDNMTARLVIVVDADDVLTVTAVSADHIVSATASADCVGNTRPTVTLSCPESLVFDKPTEFSAVGVDADGDELTYEWRIDDEIVEGETGATAELTISSGQRVSVRATDGSGDDDGLWSEAATSTCAGANRPNVSIVCPAAFYYGEPVTIRAVGDDADGDSLTYRWSLNGETIAGESTSSITLPLGPDDRLGVEVTDATGLVSDNATFDCAQGTIRPEVTLSCDAVVTHGSPVTVTAAVSGIAEGPPVVFTWAVNNTILTDEVSNSISVVLKPDDVVAVTATAGAHAVSKTTATNCTTVPPTDVPSVPSMPEVLANQVTSATQTAVRGSLAYTGSNPMRLAVVGVAIAFAGGIALLVRQKFLRRA